MKVLSIDRTCEDINCKVFLGFDDFIARSFGIHLLEQWEINQNQENATYFNFKAAFLKRKPSEIKKATQNAKKYLQTKIRSSNSSPKPRNISQCGNISIKGFHKNIASFCCSVQFSCSVVSDSLGPHGPQHAQLPCPPPNP